MSSKRHRTYRLKVKYPKGYLHFSEIIASLQLFLDYFLTSSKK